MKDIFNAFIQHIKRKRKTLKKDSEFLDKGDLVQRVIVISGFAVTAVLVVSWIASSLAHKAIDLSNCIALGSDRTQSNSKFYIGSKVDNNGNVDMSGIYYSDSKCEVSMYARSISNKTAKYYEKLGIDTDKIVEDSAAIWDSTPQEERKKIITDRKDQYPNIRIDENSTSEEYTKFVKEQVLSKKPTVEDEYNKRFG